MQWGERYELGIARMDETHREFIEYCNALTAAAPENFLACLDAFIAHTAAHFDQENRWMEAVDFPACHRAEHDRVLEVMREIRQRVEKNDLFLGRRLLEELPPWFDNHVDTMDAALAFYLKEISFDTESGALPANQSAAHARSAQGCGCSAHAPGADTKKLFQ
ncbi:MAG: hemerythrin domain-containing protein [Azoarcus sp.]|jgi:hemerythrin-like metal-binding protein|nr:hemerythrin domain-containing protein [Azoarcus sp.]